MTEVICLNCANIFPDTQTDNLTCPDCKATTERGTYNMLLAYAAEAVKYGYAYRFAYENQQDKESSKLEKKARYLIIGSSTVAERTRYAIGVNDVLIFLALAAISGPIGNATYDLFKIVIQKLRNKISKNQNAPQVPALEDEGELELFIQYVKDFYNGLEGVDPKIRAMIVEEMVVDVSAKMAIKIKRMSTRPPVDDEERKLATLDEDGIKQLLMKPRVTGSISEKPSSKELSKLWKGVSTSTPDERTSTKSEESSETIHQKAKTPKKKTTKSVVKGKKRKK